MSLPEGLHLEADNLYGPVEVVDAQGHAWVTLWNGAEGDPEEWQETIVARVLRALEIVKDDPL